jgi:hypothetical protein
MQFLEHNIQVSVLSNTLSNFCFNWKPEGILRLIFQKKIVKIYFVMAQTGELYEICMKPVGKP